MKENFSFLIKSLATLSLLWVFLPLKAQKLEIRELDSKNYPEISLVISGPADVRMNIEEENIQILENDIQADIDKISHGYHLPFGLRIFSTPQFVGIKARGEHSNDTTLGNLIVDCLDKNFKDTDYFFRKNVDTDELYDELQEYLESFGKRQFRKRWFTLLFLEQGDTGSETPFETLMGTVDFIYSPIFVLYKGDTVNAELEQLAQKSGGGFYLFDDSEELLVQLQELNRLWRWGTEITYKSPERSKTNHREVRLNLSEVEKGQMLVESYEQKSDIKGAIDWNDWPAMLFAVILSIGAVASFFVWRSRRVEANHIYPAITYVAPQVKKGKLKVRFNSPNKEMGARITIATIGGKPVKDFTFKGTRRRARINVSNLSEGFYTCMLSNAGLNSEKVEFEIK